MRQTLQQYSINHVDNFCTKTYEILQLNYYAVSPKLKTGAVADQGGSSGARECHLTYKKKWVIGSDAISTE